MNSCEFAGRHTPPPNYDELSNYSCAVCGADVRPAIVTTVPRYEGLKPPAGFGQSVRFVVHNPDDLPLVPGMYAVEIGEPHKVTQIIPFTVVRNITDDGK